MPATADARARARATAAAIEGWLTDAEGDLLFQMAAECPPGLDIVEIGSWKGKSTVWLASGARPSGSRRALRGLLWRSTEITAAKFVDSIAWMRKVRRNRLIDRLRNRFAAALLVAYEIRPDRQPAPVAAFLRMVYRFTPLKRSARERSETH